MGVATPHFFIGVMSRRDKSTKLMVASCLTMQILLLLFPLAAVSLVTGQFLPHIGQIIVSGQPDNDRRLFCEVTTGTGATQPLRNATFYLNDTDVLDLLTYNEVRFDDSGGRTFSSSRRSWREFIRVEMTQIIAATIR